MSDRDIVARLRDYESTVIAAPREYRELLRTAAAEIERLRDLLEGHDCLAMGQRDEIKKLRWLLDEARREAKP